MRFCEGQPEHATRPLAADERNALAVASRRASRKAVLAVAGAAAPLVLAPAGALLAVALGGDRPGPGLAVAILAGCALLGGLPVAAVFARDAVRAARALRRDALRGEVHVFGAGARERVVLAESLHLVGAGGTAVAPVRRAAVAEAAAAPPAPAIWALSEAELPAELGGSAWVKRALSAEERAELERHARRLGRISPVLAVASIVLAAGAAAGFSSGQAAQWLACAAVSPLLALRWMPVLRDRRLGGRLRADARDGWAYRGRWDRGLEVEVLPASGASWTCSGAPAGWRLVTVRD